MRESINIAFLRAAITAYTHPESERFLELLTEFLEDRQTRDYDSGYRDGKSDAEEKMFSAGVKVGYNNGYAAGLKQEQDAAYTQGYNAGIAEQKLINAGLKIVNGNSTGGNDVRATNPIAYPFNE